MKNDPFASFLQNVNDALPGIASEYSQDSQQLSLSAASEEEPLLEASDSEYDDKQQEDGMNAIQDGSRKYVPPELRRSRDNTFAALYFFCIGIVLLYGLYHAVFSSNSRKSGGRMWVPLLHTALVQSYGTIAFMTAVSVMFGGLWLVLLSYTARPIIIATAISIPVSLLVVSLVSFFVSLSFVLDAASQQPELLTQLRIILCLSVAGVASGVWLGLYVWTRRAMIDTITHIIELSCDVIQLNPSLFILSVLLMLAHALFSALWIYLFSCVLVGSVADSNDKPLDWALTANSTVIGLFYIFVYFWTSAIFQNVEKTTVASVVGSWYFQESSNMMLDDDQIDETARHFKFVSTRSFGPIAFASLVLGIVRFTQFVLARLRQALNSSQEGNRLVELLNACISTIWHIIDEFTAYTLIHTGLTGDSFRESAKVCSKLFRRNLVLGLLTQSVTKAISVLGKLLVSSLVGLTVFWGAVNSTTTTTNDKSISTAGDEWWVVFIATMVPYYVVGVLTHVIENTVDATFVCYLIDLDTNSCHCEGAHQIFGNSLK